MTDTGLSDIAERTVDGEPSFALRGFLTKLFVRRWIFLICAIVPMILALIATALTPVTWEAKTRILIRYSVSESSFLKDLIPENRASLSGEASSEILRSLPTIAQTVRDYDIRKEDLYRSTPKVLAGYISDWVSNSGLFGTSTPPSRDAQVTAIARTFQDSLLEGGGAALSSKTSPIEILAKSSNLPQAMRGDELITVSVRAFNREKIAAMTNGLAATFIKRIYMISAQDARRSHDFLTTLVDKSAADVNQLERNPNSASNATTSVNASGSMAPESPATQKLAAELADRQADYGRLRQVYKANAPQTRRAGAALAALQRIYVNQRRLEAARQALDLAKVRRFEALNSESLYKDRLIPISIIEPAITPAVSASARLAIQVSRPVSSGLTGLLVGSVLGFGLIVVLGLFDQRLFTDRDAEQALSLPVFGQIPVLPGGESNLRSAVDAFGSSPDGMLRLLARLDAAGIDEDGHIVAITSDEDEDGKSLVALLIATAVASGGGRVLLVDGDPVRASLSQHFGMASSVGLATALAAGGAAIARPVATGIANLDFVPAGATADRPQTGFYLRRLRLWLDTVRGGYSLVIVDTPSVTNGGGLIHVMAADKVLLVVRSGVSRRSSLAALLRQMREVAVVPQGVIVNFARQILPGFIDRHV